MSALLEEITSRDPQRVWASTWAIITLRDEHELNRLVTELPTIKATTKNLDLGGALFPNNVLLDFALGKLEFIQQGKGCLCQLYPHFIRYDPEKEEQAGNIRMLEAKHDASTWVSRYVCECTRCHTQFQVESGEYHYTWWKWEQIKGTNT